MVHVTHHAIQRYVERVSPVTEDEARQALSSKAIEIAADFGARFVRLATGQRICVRDHAVITVLPAENYRRKIRRVGRGRFG